MSDERQRHRSDCEGSTPEGTAQQARHSVVLVVDDEEAVRQLLQEALSLNGYRVTAVATIEDAEAHLLQSAAEGIALVVTDIHLTANPQGREGYELYRRWSVRNPTLRFLLISGDPSSQTLPIIQAGSVPFLSKPFTIDELLSAVRAIVGG